MMPLSKSSHRTSQLVRGRIGCLKKKGVAKLQQSRRKWYVLLNSPTKDDSKNI